MIVKMEKIAKKKRRVGAICLIVAVLLVLAGGAVSAVVSSGVAELFSDFYRRLPIPQPPVADLPPKDGCKQRLTAV